MTLFFYSIHKTSYFWSILFSLSKCETDLFSVRGKIFELHAKSFWQLADLAKFKFYSFFFYRTLYLSESLYIHQIFRIPLCILVNGDYLLNELWEFPQAEIIGNIKMKLIEQKIPTVVNCFFWKVFKSTYTCNESVMIVRQFIIKIFDQSSGRGEIDYSK